MYVWSAGGVQYAQQIVDKLGLSELVTVVPKQEDLRMIPHLTFDDEPDNNSATRTVLSGARITKSSPPSSRRMHQPNSIPLVDSPFDSYDGRRESAKTLLGFSLVYLTGYLTDPPAEFHPQLLHILEDGAETFLP